MRFDERDVRMDYCRDASVRWRGRGTVIHLPTGLVEEFDIAWDDRSGLRRAKEKLRDLVIARQRRDRIQSRR